MLALLMPHLDRVSMKSAKALLFNLMLGWCHARYRMVICTMCSSVLLGKISNSMVPATVVCAWVGLAVDTADHVSTLMQDARVCGTIADRPGRPGSTVEMFSMARCSCAVASEAIIASFSSSYLRYV